MVQLQLQKLATCEQDLNTPPANLTFYQNIYVQSGTYIDSNSAMLAYGVVNDVDAGALKMVLNEMEAQGLNSLLSPIKRGGSCLFHISRGNRRKERESASLFFRIYALTQAELTKLQNGQQAEAVEVIHIYTNTPIKTKVKITEHNIIDGIEVDQSNFKIRIGGADYHLIFDVVGIGYHLSDRNNNKYRMVYYNDNVLSQRDIDLAQQVL